ncbi:MAG: hypothetical protein JWP58_2693 [Hymenobacter sp.]|nr:hypothetical protein [Hymenobacter sp.]
MSALTDNLLAQLPTLIRTNGRTTAADVRAFETQMIAAIAQLETRARGTRIHYANGVPAAALGQEGDMGVNRLTGDYYQFTNGAFVLLFNAFAPGGAAAAATYLAGANAELAPTGTANQYTLNVVDSAVRSLVRSPNGSTLVGPFSGNLAATGARNVAVGMSAGAALTTGHENTLVGPRAGLALTTGYHNTVVGVDAGRTMTTGFYNTLLGINAGFFQTTGECNVFLGVSTGYRNTAGSYNVAIGNATGVNLSTGSYNVLVGYETGGRMYNGHHNVAIGHSAGFGGGTSNVSLGNSAGAWGGTSNLSLGNSAGPANAGITNAVALGNGAVTTQDNTLVVANELRVGIGTATPGSKLTVAGTIETTSGGLRFPDGTTQTTAAAPTAPLAVCQVFFGEQSLGNAYNAELLTKGAASIDTHRSWEPDENTFTVRPGQAGLYRCELTVRWAHGVEESTSLGLGIDHAPQDSPRMTWRTIAANFGPLPGGESVSSAPTLYQLSEGDTLVAFLAGPYPANVAGGHLLIERIR